MSGAPRDLIKRTFEFAFNVRRFVDLLPRGIANYEDAKQVVRSSGLVAANYLEAQEGLSRKDFFYRIKICRKEARESNLWLRLVNCGDDVERRKQADRLGAEAEQLKLIFSTIAGKDDT